MRKECALIGAALDIGQKHNGTEVAPSWLRVKGLNGVLNNKFYKVEDLGDLTSTHEISYSSDNPSLQEKLSELSLYGRSLKQKMLEKLRDDYLFLTVGGDHSLAIGTLAASLESNPDMKIIWVDAHADINTPETSPSGNTHGMPVALAMGLVKGHGVEKLFDFVPRLDPQNIVYIGLRDVDPGEKEFINDLGILAYTAKDVLNLGIDRVLKDSLDHLDPRGDAQFHISFDVDGVDPQYFPSTGTPVTGGLDLFQAREIIRRVGESGRLAALDLVEVNPRLGSKDDLEKTAASTFALLDALPEWNAVKEVEPAIWPDPQATPWHELAAYSCR